MTYMPDLRREAGAMPAHHTAIRCLFLLLAHHGRQLPPERIGTIGAEDTESDMARLLAGLDFRTQLLQRRRWRDIARLGSAFPALARRRDGGWMILVGPVARAGGTELAVLDPVTEHKGASLLTEPEFSRDWDGTLLLAKPRPAEREEQRPFGLAWFLPEIARQSSHFRDIALAAIAISLISLGTPLLFQVIIDRVIPHQSHATLTAVVLAFVMLALFDAALSFLRTQVMVFAGNKIDLRLASRTFQRMLRLPMPFFEATPAGVLVRHMQQTEKLRQFLTGRVFLTLLDAVMLPPLLLLLALYSVALTLVVLGFALAIAAVIAVFLPLMRRRLDRLYEAEGERQAHLVETVQGMRTVKSLSLEPLRQGAWDRKVASAVQSHAAVARVGGLAGTLATFLDKMMQLAVIALGALAVFGGSLSIGALVAFTMLSGRVSGPLLALVGLINEYQETSLSVRMLATVMDHPPERDPNSRGITPPLAGELAFEGVRYTYAGAASPALDRVGFRVGRGEILGVVGRSGSGKTTLTRLIQGIHEPQEGTIKLNGHDIRHLDLGHLRRHVGVVLQDSFLFRGTIRENIAATRPDASLEEVITAARLAGAEEFITRLPLGYDTLIVEGASNLSGGQRQRIAIARALLPDPGLLIFDEATSALDPESEAVIQENLGQIARDRTMIIVSHRLASLVQADAILVLETGRVVDCAPHATLLERCEIYRKLWFQQNRHLAC